MTNQIHQDQVGASAGSSPTQNTHVEVKDGTSRALSTAAFAFAATSFGGVIIVTLMVIDAINSKFSAQQAVMEARFSSIPELIDAKSQSASATAAVRSQNAMTEARLAQEDIKLIREALKARGITVATE